MSRIEMYRAYHDWNRRRIESLTKKGKKSKMTTEEEKRKGKKFQIAVRRWFDKSRGSTYHSVEVYVDNVFLDHEPYTYGYDKEYESTAHKILQKHGYFAKTDEHLASGLRKDTYEFTNELRKGNYQFLFIVTDVTRKKDL